MDVQTLIDKAGGVTKFAVKMGVSHCSVLDWKRDNRLPGSRVAQVSAVLGVPLEDVASLASPPRQKKEVAA